MRSRIIRSLVALLFITSFNCADAQLFKGRVQRQSGGGGNSGGSNFNSSQQQQSRGRLFQKGRERREANQFNNNGNLSNSMQQQPNQGLFGRANERKEAGGSLFNRNSNAQQYSNGSPVKQGGLFAKAKARKLQEQNQNDSYSPNHSQSSSSYVRSNPNITSASKLFESSANKTQPPRSAPTSQPFPSIPGVTQNPEVDRVANALTETNSTQSKLPSLVTTVAEAKRPPLAPNKLTMAPSAPQIKSAKRSRPRPVAIDALRLREKSPEKPDAQLTGNLPSLRKPKAESTAAVLA